MKSAIKIVLLIVICGCSRNVNEKHFTEWEESYALELSGRWTINIDEETKRYGNLISFYDQNVSLYLFNEINYSLYEYSILDSTYKRKVKFKKSGPNGLSKVSHFLFHSPDSIFFFDNLTNILRVTDQNGVVFYKEKILEADDPAVVPLVAKMKYENGNLLMPVFNQVNTKKENQNKSLMSFNLFSGNKRFMLEIPKEYQDYYGGKMLFKGLAVMEDKYVVSLPMSPDIHVLEKGTNASRQSEFTYSSEKLHYPEPYEGDMNDRQANSFYVTSNSWNESIFYDSHSELLLKSWTVGRILESKKERISESTKSLNRDNVYVVTELFNSELKKVGEINNVAFYDGVFSTPEFIYIMDYEYDVRNEDIISFFKFRVNEVK